MTVLEIIQRTSEFFAKKGIDAPRLQVELLLGHVLKLPRMKLYLQFERVLTETELEELRKLVKRRSTREPLQHIVGSTWFCGLEFETTPAALIPRPETESLVQIALEFLKRWEGERRVLELGTGSGCIIVTLAVREVTCTCVSVDVSPDALLLAGRNIEKHQVGGRIRLIQGQHFNGVDPSERFSLLVSNPPYIPTAEISTLQPEVRDFDPKLALDGGEDGLQFYRIIASEGLALLLPGGSVLVEIGDTQGEAVQGIFQKHGWENISIAKDLTGTARIVQAFSPKNSE